MEMKLRKVAESTSEFSIFFKDNPYTFTRYMKGFSWMGRHFSITSKRKNMTRLYSLCLSANKEIHDKHTVLIENIDILEKKSQPNKVILSSKELNSDYLQVYIKKYNTPNALSLYLHSSIINFSDISVKGPLGLGLNIDDKQVLSKTYISFAAGTGIYCFLDFISYAIRLLCYKVAKEKFDYQENHLLPEDTFEEASSDFKLILFYSFQNMDNSHWHNEFMKADELNRKYGYNIFEYHPRNSSSDKRLNKEYYEKAIGDITTINKAYLCGPSKYLDDIKEMLVQNKLVPEKMITLV